MKRPVLVVHLIYLFTDMRHADCLSAAWEQQ
jgi:hypothetical protein